MTPLQNEPPSEWVCRFAPHIPAGGRVLDPASDGFIVELTASEAEIDKFVADLAKGAELLEVVRSGALGISRLESETRQRSA